MKNFKHKVEVDLLDFIQFELTGKEKKRLTEYLFFEELTTEQGNKLMVKIIKDLIEFEKDRGGKKKVIKLLKKLKKYFHEFEY